MSIAQEQRLKHLERELIELKKVVEFILEVQAKPIKRRKSNANR